MRTILIFLVAVVAGSCTTVSSPSLIKTDVPTTPSALTPGMVKTKLIVGETTQAEVMEIFGPPDHVTKSGKVEMWGYDKVSREVAVAATGKTNVMGGGLLGLVGGAGGGVLGGALPGVGGGVGSSERQAQQIETTKTVFLLVYFDEKGFVMDYKLSATKF